MNSVNRRLLFAMLLAFLTATSAMAGVTVTYTETNLGGGLYDVVFTVVNSFGPATGTGTNLYDIVFNLPVSVNVLSLPSGWILNPFSSGTAIEAFSTFSGVSPNGTDVGPGQSLGGFEFLLQTNIGDVQFTSSFTNPSQPSRPLILNGTSTSAMPVPSAGNTCDGTFVGTFTGNLTVSDGQTCVFDGGGVTGNVTQDGGSFVLSNATVGANLQVQGSGTFSIFSSNIQGNLQVQGLQVGAENQLCAANIKGNVQYQNNSAGAQIGATPECPGNTIGGNVQVGNNAASTVIFGNNISGNLEDQNNSGTTQVNGNTVGGNLHVHNNAGNSTQVSNNTVTGNLQCENNAAITGSGNTAKQKQGQCSQF